MLAWSNALTALCMASVTYLTRIAGFAALRNRRLSPRLMSVLRVAPGCVLVSLLAPNVVSGELADMLALAATLIAALRLPMLPTVLIGMAAAALFRFFLT